MCSHGSVTVDPVRGDRRICHMNLSFAMLIEMLLSYPKFSQEIRFSLRQCAICEDIHAPDWVPDHSRRERYL